MPNRNAIKGFLLGASVLSTACDEHTTQQSIDLGPPRTLVYVADDVAAPKHGGSHGTADGMVHVYELGNGFAPVADYVIGAGVSEIHATPDGSLVWTVSSSSGTVSFLDTNTYALRTVRVGVNPVHSFITPDHDEIWVGNDGSADVSILSVASLTRVATVLTGAGHHKMAFATVAGGGLLRGYVSNITDGTVTPVGADHGVGPNVGGIGPAPHGMDFSAVTRFVYNCSGDANNSIEVIAVEDDAATPSVDEANSVVERIALPARCSYLHVDDADGYVYATLPTNDSFVRVSLADHQLESFATHDGPDRFAVVGDRAYVVHSRVATVAVIDMTGATPTGSIAVGNAILPGSNPLFAHRGARLHAPYLFVPNEYDGTVTVIDTRDDSVAATLAGMASPVGIAVAGPGGGTTYPR